MENKSTLHQFKCFKNFVLCHIFLKKLHCISFYKEGAGGDDIEIGRQLSAATVDLQNYKKSKLFCYFFTEPLCTKKKNAVFFEIKYMGKRI